MGEVAGPSEYIFLLSFSLFTRQHYFHFLFICILGRAAVTVGLPCLQFQYVKYGRTAILSVFDSAQRVIRYR